MKIYVVVKYTDTEVMTRFDSHGHSITETEIICAYSSQQDANIERSHLNRANKEDNIIYDVIETEVY